MRRARWTFTSERVDAQVLVNANNMCQERIFFGGASTAKLMGAFGIPQDPIVTDYYFPPYHFEDPSKKVLRWIPCLSKKVAHEALHIAIKWVVRPGGTLRSIILEDRNNHRDPNEREESWIEKTVDDCISC